VGVSAQALREMRLDGGVQSGNGGSGGSAGSGVSGGLGGGSGGCSGAGGGCSGLGLGLFLDGLVLSGLSGLDGLGLGRVGSHDELN